MDSRYREAFSRAAALQAERVLLEKERTISRRHEARKCIYKISKSFRVERFSEIFGLRRM
jgi:hypothetical protein